MTGQLFAIVGPSGAGKDTLMTQVARLRPDLHIVRRVITRPEAAGGEAFDGVTDAEFDRRRDAGAFLVHWCAHGLRYGIPAGIGDVLNSGRPALFNGSRAALAQVTRVVPDLRVILVTADPEVLARRLGARGRETPRQVAARLRRADTALPPGLDVTEIDNSGPLDRSVAALLRALDTPHPAGSAPVKGA